jgi:hypothetical protein
MNRDNYQMVDNVKVILGMVQLEVLEYHQRITIVLIGSQTVTLLSLWLCYVSHIHDVAVTSTHRDSKWPLYVSSTKIIM